MTHLIKNYFYKFRKYGIKGTITAIVRLFLPKSQFDQTLLNMAATQTARPIRGITIIGDMTTHASLPKVLCDLYQKLRDVGIPCQCLDTKQAIDDHFEILKYDHVIAMLQNPLPKKLRTYVKTGVIAFWEFDSGILEAYPQLLDGDDVIGMSEFNFQYYQKALPKEVVKRILYPLQLPKSFFHPRLSQQHSRQVQYPATFFYGVLQLWSR